MSQVSPLGDYLKEEDVKHLIAFSDWADWNMPRALRTVEIDPYTLGQLKYLPDKNGRELFGGDVGQDEKGNLYLVTQYGYKNLSGGESYCNCAKIEFELVGNIHDHPYLGVKI